MNRITVSALALIATSLTFPAVAAEPPRPTGRTAQTEKGTAPEKAASRTDEKGSEHASRREDTTEPRVRTDEPTPSRESDSLLPNDHREPRREPERPLVIRRTPEKPLELSAQTPSDSIWIKLAVCGLIVGGAVYLLRKRGLLKAPARSHTMTIVSRTGIGVRSELLVVDIDGQKLLLGVTPGSISRLAVLATGSEATALLDEGTDPESPTEHEPHFDGALVAAREKLEQFAARLKTRAPESLPGRSSARASLHAEHTSELSAEADYEREIARREATRNRARQSPAARELQELRNSRPEGRSRPDLGEQAQSLLRLRQSRGR